MKNFMSNEILLENEKGKELYAYAKDLPVFDYHCHLSPREIYENKRFFNLTQLWLEGDHYKWRIMRAYGIDERYITGGATAYEKFLKFAEALPHFIGNPVYHWAHLELKRYFGITEPLCPDTAQHIWLVSGAIMTEGDFSARKLIELSNVKTLITTDEPAQELIWHEKLSREQLGFKVLPCFRADRLLSIDGASDGESFKDYIGKFSDASGVEITDFGTLMKAVEKRLDYFAEHGCTAADVSFTDFPPVSCFGKNGELAVEWALNDEDGLDREYAQEQYKARFIVELAKMLQKRGMVLQLHTGVIRNSSQELYLKAGVDAGGDSAANAVNIDNARALFNDMFRSQSGGDRFIGELPKIIVYTLNPAAYYPLATLLGSFQGGGRGNMQLGAAWWFADHRDGIKEQLRTCAVTGGLGLFNGMLTDSRSFTSYARHDYFRRILCSLIGEWVEAGEYPDDEKQLHGLLDEICYKNASAFFGGKE